MNTSPLACGFSAVSPEPMPPDSPCMQVRRKIGLISDCLTRCLDSLDREPNHQPAYVAAQLHTAYGLMIDALVIDISEPEEDEDDEVLEPTPLVPSAMAPTGPYCTWVNCPMKGGK